LVFFVSLVIFVSHGTGFGGPLWRA